MQAEGVDVAVRVGNLRSAELIAKKVASSRYVTCASPRYLATAGVPRTLSGSRISCRREM
jgi:DNA-binding transcriptional LysR family regulator